MLPSNSSRTKTNSEKIVAAASDRRNRVYPKSPSNYMERHSLTVSTDSLYVEIEHYSIAHFDRITTFEAL